MSEIHIETLRDVAARQAAVDDLARLRVTVFREWPYLYDGSVAYEQNYLANFLTSSDAVLVVARDGSRVVGAATASPMAAQDADFIRPLTDAGHMADGLFYFGESVLLSEYRGRGIGHAFMDAREAAARSAGANATCFCGVVRPDYHPLRPASARDLGPFWRSRGYAPLEDVIAHYHWKDIDQDAQTDHPMQFWWRAL